MKTNQTTNSAQLVKILNRIYHDIEAAYYDKIHPEIFYYEEQTWVKLIHRISYMINMSDPLCLDAGSGLGFIPRKFQSFLPQSRWVCCDLSPQMLRYSKLLFDTTAKVSHIGGDCENLPFSNQVFNLVTVNSVLHHLPNIEKFLQECGRVLKPNGLLVIAHEPNRKHYQNRLLHYSGRVISKARAVKRKLLSLTNTPKIERKDGFHCELEAQLKNQGFSFSLKEISRMVDFHSPTAGGMIDCQRGFNLDLLLQGGGWREIEIKTYAHLGKLSFNPDSHLIHLIDQAFAKCFPNDGYLFWLIAQKEGGLK